ncbi:MAG: hypothetical protein WCF99_08330 [Chloroflexales bacterium]
MNANNTLYWTAAPRTGGSSTALLRPTAYHTTTMNHTTILLAPAATGKTKAALVGIAKPRRGRTILLVPSGLHRDHLAPQMSAGIPRASVYQPSRLVRTILEEARVELPRHRRRPGSHHRAY